MLVQIGFESERFVAPLAHVGLRVGVGLDVGAEVGLVGEGLGADVAAERLLSWNE